MNIWIVHPYAGGPGLGRHRRPYCMAEAFNALGHRAVVVCARHHHLLHATPEASGPARVGDVDYWFVDTPAYRGNGFSRIWNMLSFGPRLAREAAKLSAHAGRPDLVIASSPHLFQMPAVARVARRMGAKFFVEIRDLWPESLVALGLARRRSPLVIWLGWLERFAYWRCDRLLSLLANAEPYMRERGLAEGKFRWVPNGVAIGPGEDEGGGASTGVESEGEIGEAISQLNAAGRRIVAYTGAMGPPNAMEVVIDAARILATLAPDLHFVLLGSGISKPALQSRAADLANVSFFPEVPYETVQAVLNACDCAVVSFHGNRLYRMGISPNKLFEYALSAPRSLIACEAVALKGMEDLVDSRCDPNDPKGFADAVIEVLSRPPRGWAKRHSALAPFEYRALALRVIE